jgi:hypothetical protein
MPIGRRKELQDTLDITNKFNPNAYIAVEDVCSISENILPARAKRTRFWRQGK